MFFLNDLRSVVDLVISLLLCLLLIYNDIHLLHVKGRCVTNISFPLSISSWRWAFHHLQCILAGKCILPTKIGKTNCSTWCLRMKEKELKRKALSHCRKKRRWFLKERDYRKKREIRYMNQNLQWYIDNEW